MSSCGIEILHDSTIMFCTIVSNGKQFLQDICSFEKFTFVFFKILLIKLCDRELMYIIWWDFLFFLLTILFPHSFTQVDEHKVLSFPFISFDEVHGFHDRHVTFFFFFGYKIHFQIIKNYDRHFYILTQLKKKK